MEFKILDKVFAVCKISKIQDVNFSDEYFFLSKTDDEISLVCEEISIPVDYLKCEKGWKCLKIAGILDFSMVGILANISSILANNGISIFAISTYNTDYILVKEDKLTEAIGVLEKQGYQFT